MPRPLFFCFLLAVSIVVPACTASVDELVPPAGSGASEPFLSASGHGLLLSWLEPVPGSGHMALRFARLANGKWSDARTIAERNDFFVNWADFPSIVEDARGVLFAHWLQKSGDRSYAYDVRLSISADGGKRWSVPILINRDGVKNEHGFVSLAPLRARGVGAVWLDGRNMPEGKEEGEMTLRYATVSAKGIIASEELLDGRTCECCATGLAITPKGPVVVYRDRSADEIRDVAYVRHLSKGWTPPRPVRKDGWKIAGCPVNGPQIDAIGNAVSVAWFTAAGDRPRVFVAFSDDGGATFGDAVAVDAGHPLGRVDVVMLDHETAVISWLEQSAAGAEVRLRSIRRGRPAESIVAGEAAAARAAGFPRMARIGRDVYCAWSDPAAKRIRVVRVRF